METIKVSALKLKIKVKVSQCPKVFFKGDTATKDITTAGAVYPGDSQNSGKALINAKTQTKSARKFFSSMPKSSIARSVLSNVAMNFGKFLKANSAVFDILVDPSRGVARQAQDNGTWSHWNTVLNEIPEFKSLPDDKKKRKAFYENVIAEIPSGNPLPKNILGFLGLLGDVGACLQDVVGRNKSDQDLVTIKTAIFNYFGDITAKSMTFYNNYSPDNYYDKAAQNIGKQRERASCSKNDNDELKMKFVPRAGVLGVGEVVDIEEKIQTQNRLPLIGWPWQTVPKKLIDFCPDEPWAGHFSGSLYELILMLELFNRSSPKVDETPDLDIKKLYAGTSSAFLVSTGMHSAVELVYVVKNYLGTNINKSKIMTADVCTNATTYISSLISGISNKKKK